MIYFSASKEEDYQDKTVPDHVKFVGVGPNLKQSGKYDTRSNRVPCKHHGLKKLLV